jgi:Putative beta-barrel porin-2, OmpL-like. bbp2
MSRPRFVEPRGFHLVLTLMAALFAAPAWAQAPAPTPAPSPTPAPPGIDVTGFVDVYYGYNFNKVDPGLRTFDVQHNAFSLSLAEVAFTRLPTAESKVGFRVDLDFGKTADLVASFEPEDNGKEIYKHIQQAYGSLLTGKVQWDVGKFVTIHGAEVIESQDNWNYTRSVLFGYAIPFYHVGVRASVPVNDKFSLTGLVVNGWNNSSEIYGGAPCLALGATLKPSSKVTWVANFMTGQETKDATDNRNLFDTTLTLALSPKFSLMSNFDYGKEGDVKWWGIAAYAKLQARPNWAVVGRYEYLDDTDGGFMTFGQKAQTFTVTSDHTVAGSLKARFEYRLDKTENPFFTDHDGKLKDNQSTVTVGLVYLFGSKI